MNFSKWLSAIEKEDYMLLNRVHTGRKHLYERNDDFEGPYHSVKEVGIIHFHKFLQELIDYKI